MIFNCTPHKINIYGKNQVFYQEKQRKFFLKEGEKSNQVFTSDFLLNAEIEQNFEKEIHGVGIYSEKVLSIDPIPDKYLGEKNFFVVSAKFISACRILNTETKQFLTICNPVYENPENPKPIGCLGFQTNF